MTWRVLVGWTRSYAASDDPLVTAANFIALVLAWNQPAYPLYVLVAIGWQGWPALLEIAATPFFFAVPAVARRWPVAGRALLAVAATANTVFCTWLLGEAGGVELFLLPCSALAVLLFRRREWPVMAPLAALPSAAFLYFSAPPLATISPAGNATLLTMNALSAAAVTVFLCLVLSGAISGETPP